MTREPRHVDGEGVGGKKARPILFSGAMVRALLAGTKTQTRRIVKGVALDWLDSGLSSAFVAEPGNHLCPYGVPGDLLWVRESLTTRNDGSRASPRLVPMYAADWEGFGKPDRDWDWSPSIHMPRWASRLTLEITEVRVERLQDISEADAIAEGLYRSTPDDDDREWFAAHHEENTGGPPTQADIDEFNEGAWMAPGARQGWGMTKAERDRDQWGPTAQFAYRLVWESINGKESWSANPWVWAVSFKVHRQNVDAPLARGAAA